MKVKEIANYIMDEIIVYKAVSDNGDFENLYKGDSSSIPSNIADMEIGSIGATRKCVVDIKVN